MTLDTYTLQQLEREIRRQVLDIEDRKLQDALFSLLALTIEVRQRTDAQA
jgi:hypothetical protein